MKIRRIRVISGDTALEAPPKLDANRAPLLVYGHNRHHGRGWTLWYYDKGARPARVADYFIPGERRDIELAEKWARGWLALHFGDWSWRTARVFRDSARARSLASEAATTPSRTAGPAQDPGNRPGPIERPANGEKVTENRLRRVAARSGYRLVKSRRRDLPAKDHGGYVIVNARSRAVVAGDLSRGGMNLEEVEDWLQSNGDARPTGGGRTLKPAAERVQRTGAESPRAGSPSPHQPDRTAAGPALV